MANDSKPASITAAAKLWTVNSGEYEPGDGSWGVFWEPLDVKLGPEAKPYCCYGELVAFYDQFGNRKLADLVHTYDFMSNVFPHLLFLEGKWREVVGGRCEFHGDQWCMRWSVATNTKWAEILNEAERNAR